MIEIIQAGQSGKIGALQEMHRVRKLIFKDRMRWDVEISKDGLEIDQFDVPEAVYILVRDDKDRIAGVWRLTPTDGPSMIRDVWPDFLKNFPLPASPDIWELSRFGVYSYEEENKTSIKNVNRITAQLITALYETCLLARIPFTYTMYHKPVGRSIKRVGFIPDRESDEVLVDGKPGLAVRFPMDHQSLNRIQDITGVTCGITEKDLPPILFNRVGGTTIPQGKAVAYA